jgi:hypothetical protein
LTISEKEYFINLKEKSIDSFFESLIGEKLWMSYLYIF